MVTGPDFTLGFDQAINEAKEIFEKICPEEEFLPRAPDPEEIMFEDDEGYNTERTSAAATSSDNSIELRHNQQNPNGEEDYAEVAEDEQVES